MQNNLNPISKVSWYNLLACSLLLSVVVIITYSTSSSIFYQITDGSVDSSIFEIIGKYWALSDSLPYIGHWDSKGPLAFLFSALGFYLTGNRYGIAVIQILNLSITVYFTIKTLLLNFDFKKSLFFTVLSLLFLITVTEGWNTIEEYLLPYLMLATYWLCKWLKQDDILQTLDHPAKLSFIYGFILAFSLFSRLTNALSFCMVTLVICVYLIIRKKWITLWNNIIFYFMGFGLLFIPVVLYFYYHNSMHDLWYGTLLYNMEYAGSASPHLKTWYGMFITVVSYSFCILLILNSLILILKKRNVLSNIIWLSSSLGIFLWFIKSNLFTHYAIITYPFVSVLLLQIKEVKYSSSKIGSRFYLFLLSICFSSILLISLYKSYACYFVAKNKEYEYADLYSKFISAIPQRDRASFVAYNCDPALYLYYNIEPCYKYFILQDYAIERGASLKKKVRLLYNNGNAKWILKQGNKSNIDDILDRRYNIYLLAELI